MRHPQYLTNEAQLRQDRMEDLARTLTMLRRAVRERGRIDVETFCDCLVRRLAISPIPADDRDEIAALVALIQQRVKHGLHERLRKFLLPLVAALETQIEMSDESTQC